MIPRVFDSFDMEWNFAGIILVWILLINHEIVLAFVLEANDGSVVIKNVNTDPTGLFGYSLEMIRARPVAMNNNDGEAKLFVGAPKDRRPRRSGSRVEGSFSICNVNVRDGISQCSIRDPDLSGANRNEDFTDQMLGVSILVSPDGLTDEKKAKVWICAPRFQRPKAKKWQIDEDEKNYSMMLGHCFMFSGEDGFRRSRRIIPLEDKRVFFGRKNFTNDYAYGTTYAEAGMSLHATKEGQVYIGAPGAWNWTGTVVTSDFYGTSSIMTQPWSEFEPRVNDYTGYSVTSGRFLRSVSQPRQFAVGAPRAGDNRAGTVFIVNFKNQFVERIAKLKGEQTGEYFGASLIGADIDGDGLDEVIVGSPIYSLQTSKGTLKGNEEGRVSVFKVNLATDKKFEMIVNLRGNVPSARFGHSLACLGDLDLDGYQDFVVGSPYEDDGAGAVRLYFGRKDVKTMRNGPDQVLRAAKQFKGGLRGFGISFSSAVDIDNNGVADIAVGAHDSGHATLIRSRRVATVNIDAKAGIQSISVTNLKDFEIDVCLTLRSGDFGGSERGTTIAAEVEIQSDKRCHFVTAGNNGLTEDIIRRSITLVQNEKQCFANIGVTLKDFNPSPEEPPLVFKIEVNDGFQPFCKHCGVLDQRMSHSERLIVGFQSGCGADSICESDLSISASLGPGLSTPIVIGARGFITLVLTIWNLEGEPAFKPQVKMPIPNQVSLRQTPKLCKILEQQEVLMCDIIGPLRPGMNNSIEIDFDISKLVGGISSLSFNNIEVFSSSNELNIRDNRYNFAIALKTEADLEIKSIETKINDILVQEDEKSYAFTEKYQIRRYLSSPIRNISTWFNIPISFDNRTILSISAVYLSPPQGGQAVKCSVRSEITRIAAGYPDQLGDYIHKLSNISCNHPGVKCHDVECPSFDLITEDAQVTVDIEMELNLNFARERFENRFSLSSTGHVRFPDNVTPYINPALNERPDTTMSLTVFYFSKSSVAQLKWWQILIASFSGLVILLCIVIVCVKLGFFARKKKPNQTKEQASQEELQELKQPMPVD